MEDSRAVEVDTGDSEMSESVGDVSGQPVGKGCNRALSEDEGENRGTGRGIFLAPSALFPARWKELLDRSTNHRGKAIFSALGRKEYDAA